MFIIVYIIGMYQIFKTENYLKWFKKLRDNTAKYVIILRIDVLKTATSAILKAWVKKFLNCELILEKDIEFILQIKIRKLLFF